MVGSVKDYMVLFVKVFKKFHFINVIVVLLVLFFFNLLIFIFNLFILEINSQN